MTDSQKLLEKMALEGMILRKRRLGFEKVLTCQIKREGLINLFLSLGGKESREWKDQKN